MATLVKIAGFEPDYSILSPDAGGINPYARITTTFSPRAGGAHGRCPGASFADTRGRFWVGVLGGHGLLSLGETHAFSFDFRINNGTIDCPIFQLQGNGGTQQVFNVYFDQTADKLVITQNNGTSGKGTTLATGSLTITAGTWYRCFVTFKIPAGGGTNNQEILVHVQDASTDSASGITPDVTAVTSNQSNSSWAAYIGGDHGASLGLAQTFGIDNVGAWRDVVWGAEHYLVVVGANVVRDGTDNMFTPSTGNRYQCVDEAVLDTADYVEDVLGAVANVYQTFALWWPVVQNYDRPAFLTTGMYHANPLGAKWTAGHVARTYYYSGTVIETGGVLDSLPDPATGALIQPVSKALNGDPAQIAGLEIGVAITFSSGGTVTWRVMSLVAELAFIRGQLVLMPFDGGDQVRRVHRVFGF